MGSRDYDSVTCSHKTSITTINNAIVFDLMSMIK